MKTENPADNHICKHCNNNIPSLTYRLQQHPTSSLWLKHGKCSAACISPNDIKAVITLEDLNGTEKISHSETVVKKGNYRTNILLALSRANDLEEKSVVNRLKKANRIIMAGRLIGATGISAALLLLFYEMFILSVIFSFLGVVGILICKYGMWKKYRIK
ncbi:MAG: hypothetical protein U5K32_00260 [Bacteroidales bacterium]|nr:hypothetical protein [Bacteroidales bacterium]